MQVGAAGGCRWVCTHPQRDLQPIHHPRRKREVPEALEPPSLHPALGKPRAPTQIDPRDTRRRSGGGGGGRTGVVVGGGGGGSGSWGGVVWDEMGAGRPPDWGFSEEPAPAENRGQIRGRSAHVAYKNTTARGRKVS